MAHAKHAWAYRTQQIVGCLDVHDIDVICCDDLLGSSSAPLCVVLALIRGELSTAASALASRYTLTIGKWLITPTR